MAPSTDELKATTIDVVHASEASKGPIDGLVLKGGTAKAMHSMPSNVHTRRQPVRNAPLEELHEDEDLLVRIAGMLNKGKVRMMDMFRHFDHSADGRPAEHHGLVDVEELRNVLYRMRMVTSEEEFATVLTLVNQGENGAVDVKLLDKALLLVAKKARAERRGNEVDTWQWQRRRSKQPGQTGQKTCRSKFDWSRRVFRTVFSPSNLGNCETYSQLLPTEGAVGTSWPSSPRSEAGACSLDTVSRPWSPASARSMPWGPTDLSQTYVSDGADTIGSWTISHPNHQRPSSSASSSRWCSAALGPAGASHMQFFGSGSILDCSVARQRLPETIAAARALPPNLEQPALPIHKTAQKAAVFHGRFDMEPSAVPSEMMLPTALTCATALRVNAFSKSHSNHDHGVRQFHNSALVGARITSPVFFRKHDLSRGRNFDKEADARMFEAFPGVPSWRG